jgi:hypothetical protein
MPILFIRRSSFRLPVRHRSRARLSYRISVCIRNTPEAPEKTREDPPCSRGPFAVPSPVAPASGFVLYDNDLAVVETLAGRLDITDPAIIALYTRWLEQLREAAVTGNAAAELSRQTAIELTVRAPGAGTARRR